MAFCGKCGAEIAENVRFCPSCGADQNASPNMGDEQNRPAQQIVNLNGTADTTGEFDPADIQANKVQAVLSYFGVLVLIPIFMAKNSKFARFHANQGLILAICSIVLNVLSSVFTSLDLGIISLLISLIGIVLFVLSIIGIVNAAQGKAKELPIVGSFKILK